MIACGVYSLSSCTSKFISLGVCTDSDEDDDEDNAPLMILEYMPYGDLKRFLGNHKYVMLR